MGRESNESYALSIFLLSGGVSSPVHIIPKGKVHGQGCLSPCMHKIVHALFGIVDKYCTELSCQCILYYTSHAEIYVIISTKCANATNILCTQSKGRKINKVFLDRQHKCLMYRIQGLGSTTT
jgi:hypothetical protein